MTTRDVGGSAAGFRAAAATGPGPDLPPQSFADVLASDLLVSPTLVAGSEGTIREVSSVAVAAVPDIGPWLRTGQLLITTTSVLGRLVEPIGAFLTRLDRRGVAGLAVRLDDDTAALPAEMCDAADELGFPVVVVSDLYPQAHPLAGDLAALSARQVDAVFEADRLRRVLVDVVMAGGGFAELSVAVARELGGAVLITTPDGRQLCRAGDESELTRLASSAALDSTGRVRTDSTEGGLGLHRLGDESIAVSAISANGIDHGRLVQFSTGRQLRSEDLYLVEQAAAVCALVVARELVVSSVEEKHRANFIRDLLLGRGGEHEHVVAHAKTFGWDLDRPVVVVVIEPDPVGEDEPSMPRMPLVERQARAFTSAVAGRDTGAAVTALATETVILMGVGTDTMNLVHELVATVRGAGGGGRRPFGVGVSRPTDSVDGIPALYGQARTALKVGRQITGAWAVTHFDDLGVYRLLSLVEDDRELESFAQETLRELTADTSEAQDMRRTLEVLLATNINIAETARQLHFHYNTLRYRVVKLEKMLGSFTEHPELRLDLSLALKIMAMRGINS
ncbi:MULTISPECIES: PucR family transcriptional regulator [unclassified Rhodococcus (in: high G+C Gram-positive bacteria)]|uniref:PucR family transcriptional regulator n=1 Tax=unclassified Rhodococcus (in: high G+C Gram-positive bacteria) TaxID=192944 RepID=UPI001639AE42|nr:MULTISPECIES: PucR family transcriptional regulator [unclassified Rhodococcus (in: high G+C Gram-positive bacteria)]MBC2640942.1 PucR family transcriptional regulator ligand-binding domain-containing protein [Rhodococcus sp. 3A]MBC2894315.1 PucR family transcriptional regulator ligand-binding domain-containing protein [Rhodococcus sp. 4CII]